MRSCFADTEQSPAYSLKLCRMWRTVQWRHWTMIYAAVIVHRCHRPAYAIKVPVQTSSTIQLRHNVLAPNKSRTPCPLRHRQITRMSMCLLLRGPCTPALPTPASMSPGRGSQSPRDVEVTFSISSEVGSGCRSRSLPMRFSPEPTVAVRPIFGAVLCAILYHHDF